MNHRSALASYLHLLTCIFAALAFTNPVRADSSSATEIYISDMKRKVQAQWHPHTDTKDGLLVTKIKLSLKKSGKVKACEILQASKSAQEDRSVQRFLKSFTFAPLPNNEQTYDLYLTMMTDGRTNMVATGDSPRSQSADHQNDTRSGK